MQPKRLTICRKKDSDCHEPEKKLVHIKVTGSMNVQVQDVAGKVLPTG